jgi:hypothetical protein
MTQYILIRLQPNNGSPEFDCYQEVSDQGYLLAHRDMDGNIIETGECSGYVLDAKCPVPAWAVPAVPSEPEPAPDNPEEQVP